MGGHLTHGWSVSISGKYFTSVPYGIRKDTGLLDYDEIRDLARRSAPPCSGPAAPPIRGCGTSRSWHRSRARWARKFCADIAHIAGLVVGGVHPSPIPHADVVTTTSHKTLRGPRGGMILCRAEHARRSTRRCSPAFRAARTSTTRGAGGRAQGGGAASTSRTTRSAWWPTPSAHGGHAHGQGVRRRVGRNRQPPHADRSHQQERLGQDRGPGAGQGRNRAQLQRRPLRHPQAVRPLGDPARLAGGVEPRDGRGRDAPDRAVDRPRGERSLRRRRPPRCWARCAR